MHEKRTCLLPVNSPHCTGQHFQIVAYANESQHIHLWEFWPSPSSPLCLSFPGFHHACRLLIELCRALCSVSYQVRGLHWGMAALSPLTSPKVTQKGAKLSSGTRKAPRGPHLQFKGKLANQTLRHCQKEIDVKKLSDKCLILKTYLNQHIIS